MGEIVFHACVWLVVLYVATRRRSIFWLTLALWLVALAVMPPGSSLSIDGLALWCAAGAYCFVRAAHEIKAGR